MKGIVIIIGCYLAMLVIVGPLRGIDGQFLRPNANSIGEVKATYLADLVKARTPRTGLQAALEKNLALLPISKTTGPVSFPQIISILGLGQLNSLSVTMLPLAVSSIGVRVIGWIVLKRF
ncbi:MAG: hypothetical protein DWQ07_17455 [Chloroflexi bacterium]|nr:MAG: hypothetical protein DWQ07_17455 [Chloroflexota bacterium]MBL1197483.1 hypothetical protein [Chloroflexota bacterium]NOH14778.1 hypothetical protein [Chloroflexota bacterium]